MKYINIALLILFLQIQGFSQHEKPDVPYQKISYSGDTLPYIWYEADSVREWDNSMYFNEYSKIFLPTNTIVQDSFVYNLNTKFEFFDNFGFKGSIFDGIYISKRNVHSGNLVWQSHYNHLETGRQEMPVKSRINDKGNLEVIGFRRFLPPDMMNLLLGLFGYNDFNLRLFYREYDSQTGNLLQHHYPDTSDINAPILKETFPNNRAQFFFIPRDTTIRYFQTLFNENNKYGYITFLLDKYGQQVSDTDTIKTNVFQAKSNVLLTKNNEFLVVEIDNFKKELFFHYYSLKMEYLRTVEATKLSEFRNVSIHQEQPEDFLIISDYFDIANPPYFLGFQRFIMNYEGAIIDSFTVQGQDDAFIYTDEGQYFGIQTFRNPDDNTWNHIFRRKKIGGPLEELKSFKLNGDYHSKASNLVFSNGKIILRNAEYYKNITVYRAYSTIVVSAEDLGFPVFTKNVKTQHVNWQITPNPVFDNFDISFDTPQTGKLSIFDTAGSLIWQDNINNSQRENISVLLWRSGMYFVRFTSIDGGVSVKKMMKI